ncbi:MAG: hypothetical protein PHQ04_11755 [Opitutaceae bacterium]|nr:hypothetical protein [Opitutaceae bacterium]
MLLKTTVFSVAKLRLIDEAARIERLRTARHAVASGSATMGERMGAYAEQTRARTDTKEVSKTARIVALKKYAGHGHRLRP